jgi:hypothetical protein
MMDGKECRLEMIEQSTDLIGIRTFKCSLGHRSYDTTSDDDPTKFVEVVFRRSLSGETWHFMVNCSLWPINNFIESDNASGATICNECLARSSLAL